MTCELQNIEVAEEEWNLRKWHHYGGMESIAYNMIKGNIVIKV